MSLTLLEIYNFSQEHLLSIVLVSLTAFLLYYYFVDKNKIYKISRKYKDSIYQTQSKIFLNATHYLISGDKDQAIKEFLNAVDNNKETIDTHLTLGRLFRVNGEIDKAVNIHRSLLARENIDEAQKLESLKELAKDFDKGGFLDKAVETYKEVLKFDNEQIDVIKSLCRIFEDLEDWDEALKYRLHLSKASEDKQSETISHIHIEQAKKLMRNGDLVECSEKIEQALRYSPSASAKIIQLKYFIIIGKLDDAKALLVEIINEHGMFLNFMFSSLDHLEISDGDLQKVYFERLKIIKKDFLKVDMQNIQDLSPSLVLSKLRVMEEIGMSDDVYQYYRKCIDSDLAFAKSDVFEVEFIKFLIATNRNDEALEITSKLIRGLEKNTSEHFCSHCGYQSDEVFWRCPQCFEWETINFRYELS